MNVLPGSGDDHVGDNFDPETELRLFRQAVREQMLHLLAVFVPELSRVREQQRAVEPKCVLAPDHRPSLVPESLPAGLLLLSRLFFRTALGGNTCGARRGQAVSRIAA